ncbi:hypothetical protein GCM10010833_16370 [Blastomonas aquatica]|uniref:Integrase n=1 Tax=Blastomonas aquatica TaxID=1510276 RepID=A0ABQ1J8G0_9SPHN|nr:hypothetical protein GCM10010833_16370 [Blastomonas aquatica]
MVEGKRPADSSAPQGTNPLPLRHGYAVQPPLTGKIWNVRTRIPRSPAKAEAQWSDDTVAIGTTLLRFFA